MDITSVVIEGGLEDCRGYGDSERWNYDLFSLKPWERSGERFLGEGGVMHLFNGKLNLLISGGLHRQIA